jgi:hypothetical protein
MEVEPNSKDFTDKPDSGFVIPSLYAQTNVQTNPGEKEQNKLKDPLEIEVIADEHIHENDIIMQELSHLERMDPPNPNDQKDVTQAGAGANACHLAGALRLLAHSDWPQGIAYPHPIHLALRHVARNGKQNDLGVENIIHRSLRLTHPEAPHDQQDAMHTLDRILTQLTDPRFQQGFVSKTLKKEMCKNDTCSTEIAHPTDSFVQIATVMDDETFDLPTIFSKFSSEFKDVDRKCSECGADFMRGTNAFEEIANTLVISTYMLGTNSRRQTSPLLVGTSADLPGRGNEKGTAMMCVAELRYIIGNGDLGSSGHYIVVETSQEGTPIIYDPLTDRYEIHGITVAIVVRKQTHY